MPQNEFSNETIARLGALEQREYVRMMNHPDFLGWPHHIQEAAKHFPPFYLYRLKSTGQIVRITEYNDKKDDREFPVMFKCLIDPTYNKGAATKLTDMSGRQIELQREIFGVPPADLEKLMLRKVADQARVIENAKNARALIPMAARSTSIRKSRKIRDEHNRERSKWAKDKETKTSYSMNDLKSPILPIFVHKPPENSA
jgi:hypothetical protein